MLYYTIKKNKWQQQCPFNIIRTSYTQRSPPHTAVIGLLRPARRSLVTVLYVSKICATRILPCLMWRRVWNNNAWEGGKEGGAATFSSSPSSSSSSSCVDGRSSFFVLFLLLFLLLLTHTYTHTSKNVHVNCPPAYLHVSHTFPSQVFPQNFEWNFTFHLFVTWPWNPNNLNVFTCVDFLFFSLLFSIQEGIWF